MYGRHSANQRGKGHNVYGNLPRQTGCLVSPLLATQHSKLSSLASVLGLLLTLADVEV